MTQPARSDCDRGRWGVGMEEGLDVELLLILSACLVVWGLLSARLERFDISAPIAFVALGLIFENGPLSLVHVAVRGADLRSLAEITLALLLFSGAALVNLRELKRDAGVPLRLLFIGLPLSVALGAGLAILLFPGLDPWAAAVIAAAVAPTDAALGEAVTSDRSVPPRIRRILTVESGLNDGIATPFVTIFIAVAAGESVFGSGIGPGAAVADMLIGAGVGVGIGLVGGALLSVGGRRGWSAPTYRAIAVLGLALVTYAAAVELGGNGFISAFVGGLAFGAVVNRPARKASVEFDTRTGELLSLLVWFFFGAIIVKALEHTTWQTVVFAVLALTVVRMMPVALGLIGTHLGRPTVLFIGWFGPRGLASVVFGLIAFDAFTGSTSDTVAAAITLTILLSVIAHGLTARPGVRLYARLVRRPPRPAAKPR